MAFDESNTQQLLRLLHENDSRLRFVDSARFEGSFDALGQALTRNTKVCSVLLNLDSLWFCNESSGDHEKFVEYIRTSTSLRTFSISGFSDNSRVCSYELMTRFTNAVAENTSIQSLHYDDILHHDWRHWQALAHLMGKLSGCKRLHLGIRGEDQRLNDSQRNLLASVFGETEHRRPFDWFTLGIHGAIGVVIRDLLAIRSHCHLISGLVISSSHDQMTSGLAQLVGSLPRLRDINLSDFDVSEGLLSALSSSPCEQFCFDRCRFDSTATRMLGEMRNVCNGGVNSSLEFFECHFEESTYDNVFVHCLVGSSIDCLSCRDSRLDMAAFFAGMMKNQSNISVSQLRLGMISRQEMDVLARFLPMSTGLHELTFRGVDRNPNGRHQIFDAIRRNGSLRRLQWGVSTPQHFRPVLLRNESLPKLLANPHLDETASDDTANKTDLVLFPMLFCVARQAPRMALNTILVGLLAAPSDSFGPCREAKRRSTST
jgi:hypothetical protein